MNQRSDGMSYAPKGKPSPAVGPGEFRFAALRLEHGHIYGMCNGLTEAGAELAAVHDADPAKVAAFVKAFPGTRVARSEEEILDDAGIRLIAAAAVPCDRGPLGCAVMERGKDYFTDKTPFTGLRQLEAARLVAARTGRKYLVYFSERLHVESAVAAGDLIAQGRIGRVVQVIGLGPHRLNPVSRPEWFYKKAQYGGILCDIGSHQIEQFLFYTGNEDATVLHAKAGNYGNPEHPELEDFGDATLVGTNGSTGYFRVDWFTPPGLGTWGDGRTFIIGTAGTMELRKYVNVATAATPDHLFLVDDKGEHHLKLSGTVGFPFFGRLVRDCLDRTEHAMTQAHAFKAAELCLKAQESAARVGPIGP